MADRQQVYEADMHRTYRAAVFCELRGKKLHNRVPVNRKKKKSRQVIAYKFYQSMKLIFNVA